MSALLRIEAHHVQPALHAFDDRFLRRTRLGFHGWHDAENHSLSGVQRLREVVVRRGIGQRQINRESDEACAAKQPDRHLGRTAVHDRHTTLIDDRLGQPLQRRRGRWGIDPAVTMEARGCGHLRGQDSRQGGLVDLHEDLGDRRQSATYVGQVDPHAFGQGLREVAAGAEVAQYAVAARLLHGGGQRPRSGDLELEPAGEPLGVLLQGVQVLGEQ